MDYFAEYGRPTSHGSLPAARHLLAPTYIVDYARMKKITLDDVHREVRRGLLRTYWHDGICFIDADNTKGSLFPRTKRSLMLDRIVLAANHQVERSAKHRCCLVLVTRCVPPPAHLRR